MENLKNLRIVDILKYHPIKTQLGHLSSHIEYKLKNPNSERKLITDEEIFESLRKIIDLVEDL